MSIILTTPGIIKGITVGLNWLDEGDTVLSVAASTSDGLIIASNETATSGEVTISGTTYAAAEAIEFDLSTTETTPPSPEVSVYLLVDTVNGEKRQHEIVVKLEQYAD